MSSSAERTRKYWRRKQAGIKVIGVEVDDTVVDRLVSEGWISESDRADRDEIAEALSDVFDCWARDTLTRQS